MDSILITRDAAVAVIFIAAGLTVLGSMVAHYWYKIRREEIRAGLKQAMLERGMSAYEIRTVIEAGSDPAPEITHAAAGLKAAKPAR